MSDLQIKDQDGVFTLIFDQDDISWQQILHDLVRTNQMNPWNIDISILSRKYMEMISNLEKTDFRISGKVVLAAALLLKMKSNRLLGADLDNLDTLFAQRDEPDDFDFENDENIQLTLDNLSKNHYNLIPRTPQARKRKVSIYDLIGALQKAMEVKKRRVMRELPPMKFSVPEKTRDISEIISEVFSRIQALFSKSKDQVTFSKLLPSGSKTDKVYTFIPLLHLTNARRIDIHQEQHFSEIHIELLNSKVNMDKELSKK